MQLFGTLGSEATMDLVDNLIIQDSLRDSQVDGRLVKARAVLNKEYGRIGSGSTASNTDYSEPPIYAEQTEDGFIGLGIEPLG